MDYSKRGVRARQRELNARGQKWTRKLLLTLVKLCIVAVCMVAVCGAALSIGLFRGILEDTPNVRVSDVVATGQATIVYDNQGNEIDQYVSTNSNRIEVTIDQIPEQLGQAFVALEDERFYEHNGIDFIGIVRAGYQFITTGGKEKQGASTITQQLLKNTVFTSWTEEGDNLIKQLKRKIQEQYLALELTKNSTKDEVLVRYMNAINLGQNTLGVEAASLRYFGKSCSELTLSECAVVASITQNPSQYNPISHPDNNAKRRETCLNKMLELGYITQEEYDEAMADTDAVYDRISLHNVDYTTGDESTSSYFSDALYEQVIEDLVEAGYPEETAEYMMNSGGLRIDSTLDPDIQAIADEEFQNPDNWNEDIKWYLDYALTITDEDGEQHNYSKENMMSWFKENQDKNFNLIFDDQDSAYEAIDLYRKAMMTELGMDEASDDYEESVSMTAQPQAAIVIEDQTTGYVVAMVGGRGTKEGRRTLNRATSAGSSPGSTFKVLAAFAPALDADGQTLANVYYDGPFNYASGSPVKNWYSSGYKYANMSIRDAITESLNIIAVKTITVVTPQVAYDYLINFGFTTLTDGTWIGDQYYTDVNQSTALGGVTNGVSPYELNAAYASIANLGTYVEPKLYTKVTDADGNVILDNTTPESHQVLKETTAFLLTSAMEDVVTDSDGTAGTCNFDSGMAIAGKTGTSQEYMDVWFAGFTPYYTATVWAGYDNNVKMTEKVDKNTAKTLWKAIMSRVHENLEDADFETPGGLVQVAVCSKSGKLPNYGVCDAAGCVVTEYFEAGTEPTETCDIHYTGTICAYDNLIASAECPFAVQGTVELSLIEDESLWSGYPTTVTTNADGSETVSTQTTSNYCQHDASFYADPNYEAILNQQQAELDARNAAAAAAAEQAAQEAAAAQDGTTQ